MLNINIINSKLFINGCYNTYETYNIYKRYKIGDLYNKYYCINKIILEFNVVQFVYFLQIIKRLIDDKITFNYGYDLYRNLFYILLLNDCFLTVNIDDIKNEYYEYYKLSSGYSNTLIGSGGYGRIYEYNENYVIKLGFLDIAINEFINNYKLINAVKTLNISFNIINFNKIILYHNTKYSFFSQNVIEQKFFLGFVMQKLDNIDVLKQISNLKKILNNFTIDINLLNSNDIYIMDLKNNNVLWDKTDKKITLIDFDAIDIDNKNKLISTGHNTNLYYEDNNIKKCDICGLMEIILHLLDINMYDILLYMSNKLNYPKKMDGLNNILKFRMYLKKNINREQQITLIKKFFELKNKKIDDNIILLIHNNIYDTNKINDVLMLIHKYF